MQNTVGSPGRVIVVPGVARDCLALDTQMRALSVVDEHYLRPEADNPHGRRSDEVKVAHTYSGVHTHGGDTIYTV